MDSKIEAAFGVLSEIKKTQTDTPLSPWDHEYYKSLIRAKTQTSYYLDIDSIITTMSDLFSSIYDINLVRGSVDYNTVWNKGIMQLEVRDKNGHLGDIYLDLWKRSDKMSGAAHYTIRCARRVWDWEKETLPLLEGWNTQEDLKYVKRKDETWQTPLVVLVCSFQPERVTLSQVETLFHEMGHALHCTFYTYF